MAVDANVIIYERIKEEVRAGKGIKLAIQDGYKNAYSAIIDGNVTTLLTGIVLYVFGTGPVQGFATTLIIGILSSLFTAIFISRLIFTWMLERNMKINFSTKATANVLANTDFDFIAMRKKAYILSAVLILISLGRCLPVVLTLVLTLPEDAPMLSVSTKTLIPKMPVKHLPLHSTRLHPKLKPLDPLVRLRLPLNL